MRVTSIERFLGCMAALLVVAGSAQAGLIITGVMDGTLTGGQPKTLELKACCDDIPDLSKYAIRIASNGSPTFSAASASNIFPAVALSAGDYYYGVGNSFVDQTGDFDTIWPAYSGIRSLNFGVNSNGDDVLGLFYDPTGAFTGSETLIDVAGDLGVDGTGTAWEYLDGWMYRNDGESATTTFDATDWYYSGPDAMDGFTAAQIAASFPDQTFDGPACIPEPASVVLMLMVGLALAGVRRTVRS